MSGPWQCSTCKGWFDTWDLFDTHQCPPTDRGMSLEVVELGFAAMFGLHHENAPNLADRTQAVIRRARRAEPPATVTKPRNRRPRLARITTILGGLLLFGLSSCTYAQLAQVNAGEQHVAWEHTEAGRGESQLVFCASSSDPSIEVILQWVPAWVLARSNCADSEWVGQNNVMVQRIEVPPPTITHQIP